MNKSPKVTSLTDIDLRSLADVNYESDSFLTVYFGTAGRISGQSFVASRLGAVQKALPRDLSEAFEETHSMIDAALSAPVAKGERGRVIFASAPHGFLHVYRLSVEPEPLVVWDSSPFLLPLARLKGEYEDYGSC